MSRLAKKAITIPNGISVNIENDEFAVSSSSKKLMRQIPPSIFIRLEDHELFVSNKDETNKDTALLGTTHSLIKSCIKGIESPFTTSLDIVGVGFKAELIDNDLLLFSLGYSHDIFVAIPTGVNVVCEKPTLLHVSCHDKETLGHFVAKIQKLRKKDPYKGKGIYKTTEYRIRKKGKNK